MYPVRMAVFAAGCLILTAPAFAQETNPAPQPQKPAVRPNHRTRAQVVDEFLKKYDTKGKGYLVRDDLPAALRGRFDELDAERDGKLDREDLLDHVGVLRRFEHRGHKGIGREQRHELRDQRREVRVQRHEKNEQGGGALLGPAVFGVGFRLFTSDEPGRTVVQMVYEVLRDMDKNKDGNIDHAEWQAALDQIREFRVNNIMRRQGQEGKIAKDRARGTVRAHFSEWDTNKDGFIDSAELRQAFHLKPKAAKPAEEKVTTEPGEE